MTVHDLVNAVTSGSIDHMLKNVHDPEDLGFLNKRAKIISAAEKFSRLYPLRDDIHLFFAPVRSDISLSFGDFSISAVSSSAVVIASFHGETAINVSAGNVTVVLDTDSGVSTGINGIFLRNITEKYNGISGFDMIIEADDPVSDIASLSSTIESVLDHFYKKRSEITPDPELFFAGYSLCVTNIPGAEPSEIKNICEPPTNMTEEDFYSRLPELKNEMSEAEILGISRFFRNICRSELISEAISSGDLSGFFRLIDHSSGSLIPQAELALNLSSRLLQGDGASFTGDNSVIAFVPTYTAARYAEEMDRVFGNCSVFKIGSSAASEITI